MRRRYRRDRYADRVHTIRRFMPDACIGVDVIVGFPAEDEAHFENSYTFLHALPVSYLHVFTYSERAQTTAVDQPDRMGGQRVPKAERARRNRRLRILSEKKRHAHYTAHLGDVRTVLWEGAQKDGMMYGFTDNYVKVRRPYAPEWEGRLEPVRLSAFADDGTVAAGDPALQVL